MNTIRSYTPILILVILFLVPTTIQAKVNVAKKIIGRWSYEKTIATSAEKDHENKTFFKWIMQFNKDGTCTEETQLKEKDRIEKMKCSYSVDGNIVLRKHAPNFTVLKITGQELEFTNVPHTRMVFKRIKH